MKHVITHIILFSITTATFAGSSTPRLVEMTIGSSMATKDAQQIRLLPTEKELTDADAAPLYEKAIESLPEDFNQNQINEWRKMPLDELPQDKIKAMLEPFKATLQSLKKAAECQQCNWDYYDLNQNLNTYRNLVYVLTLQIRLQIAQCQYDNAIDSVRTGFSLARNLSKEPSLVHGLVAVAISTLISQQIEQLVQIPDAPSLYQALREMPKPFIDLTEQAKWEDEDAKERVYLLTNRLDRQVALLQCIEALRLYAGSHDGKFPNKLGDVTEVSVPDDPVTEKPFSYTSTDSEAVIELEGTEGSEDRDAVRYELKLKE